MWLDDAALDRIEKVVNENRALTEAEVREITTQQLHNVLKYQRPKSVPKKNNKLLLFFGIPFLVLVAVSLYLIVVCYPTGVFLWGDEVTRTAL
jgi:hypothetical protein